VNSIDLFLSKTERINALISLGVLAVVVAILGWGFTVISLLLGLGSGALNLRFVSFLAKRIIQAAREGRGKGAYVALLGGKLGLLILLCFLMVVVIKVEVISFLIGISVVYGVLLFAGFRFIGDAARTANEGSGEGR